MFEFYTHNLTRKFTVGFGSLFNNIYIAKYNADKTEKERVKVSLSYGPKQKFITRLNEIGDGEITNRKRMILPKLGFELTNFQYDTQRKTQTISMRSKELNNETKQYQYNKVPYNISYDLHIMTKNTEEAHQIIEQILPYFTPDYTLTIEEIGILNRIDVPVYLQSVSKIEDYEGDFNTDRKYYICTMNFVLQGYYLGPVKEQKVIKYTDTYINYIDDMSLASADSGLTLAHIEVGITGGATAGTDFGLTGTYTRINEFY